MSLPRPSRTIKLEKETPPAPKPVSVKKASHRPSDVFVFEPLPDITVQELAYLLMLLYEPAIHFSSYLKIPEHIQRHFRATKA